MVNYGFIFDIIIVRIDAPYNQFPDPNLLTVDVIFNNVPLKITPSRINVVDFRSGRSYEFDANPDELRCELENSALHMQVKYDDEIVGTGRMVWPTSVLDKINDTLGELTHVDECELLKDTDKIGCVELILRLQCKCQEMGSDECAQNGEDIRKHLDRVINPHDILFVVGESHKEKCGCDELLQPRGSTDNRPPTALDLSQYRSMNGKIVQSPDVLNTCMNTDCCELKKISNQYQQLIDSITGDQKETSGRACHASAHCSACPHDNKFSTSSSTRESSDCKFPCSCFAHQHVDEGAFSGEKLQNLCPQTSPPNLQQTVHHTPKRCPVCKENVTWLPKLAACPKCGYKPVPYVEEKPYNERLTADQILQEYMDKCSSGTEQQSQNADCKAICEQKECRCTCKNGKICAHCRIRKLCEDIFQSTSRNPAPNNTEDCGKCEAKSSELFNLCKTSSKDCRPYLARVFSELKDLYDIKESKRKSFDLNPKCEKALHATDQKPSQHRAKRTSLQNQEKTQSLQQNQENSQRQRRKKLVKRSRKEKACYPKKSQLRQERAYKVASHKDCNGSFPPNRKNVPPNMGWLWTADSEALKHGWKPGAIRKPIKEMMKYFLKDFPADTLRVSQYAYRNQGKGDCKDEEVLVQKPTLHICKKNDEYFITLRPLKDPEALKVCADPYLNMKPIQFKIVKNPLVAELRKLKRCLKDMGFDKCTCHQPVIECFCRSFIDKKRLEYQVNKECRKRRIPCCNETLVLSDTTDSDVEFDFGVTPPAGVIKPERLKKPNLVNHGTQYIVGDWNVPPIFPKPPNPYMRFYNCAVGERYGGGGGFGQGGGFGGRGGGFGQGGQGGGFGQGGGGPGGGPGGNRSGGGAGGNKSGGGQGGPGGKSAGGAGGQGGAGGKGKAGGGPGGRNAGGAAGGGGAGGGGAGGGGGGGAGGAGAGGGAAGGGGAGGAKGGKNAKGVDMMKYLNKSITEGANKKSRLRNYGEVIPPLICAVERKGKPIDPCMCCEEYIRRNNRIC